MKTNYHTHTARCRHAWGTDREYAEAAVAAGMEVLGFSDHTPYFFPGEYYSRFRMYPEELDGYIQSVLSLKEEYQGRLAIHLGLEVEYYPALLPQLLKVLRSRPVEYLLLGQHYLGNEAGDVYSGAPTEDDRVLERYCRQTEEALETGLFTCFAHPDLICYKGSPKVYRQEMRRLCQKAKECGVPLELNLLGLRDGRAYPREEFWQIAGEVGNRVVLGCDAHDPGVLADRETEEKAEALLQKCGLKREERLEFRRF